MKHLRLIEKIAFTIYINILYLYSLLGEIISKLWLLFNLQWRHDDSVFFFVDFLDCLCDCGIGAFFISDILDCTSHNCQFRLISFPILFLFYAFHCPYFINFLQCLYTSFNAIPIFCICVPYYTHFNIDTFDATGFQYLHLILIIYDSM